MSEDFTVAEETSLPIPGQSMENSPCTPALPDVVQDSQSGTEFGAEALPPTPQDAAAAYELDLPIATEITRPQQPLDVCQEAARALADPRDDRLEMAFQNVAGVQQVFTEQLCHWLGRIEDPAEELPAAVPSLNMYNKMGNMMQSMRRLCDQRRTGL